MERDEYKKMDAMEREHWWFKAKRSILQLVLETHHLDHQQLQALDVGCGTGAILELLQTNGYQARGIDMSEEALRFCREKNLVVSYGLINNLPFTDNTFDIVVAADVLEHVEEDGQALTEIKRILKPGGFLIATVPAHPFLFSYHDVALHHVRRYTRSQFQTVLQSNFSVARLAWIHAFILLPAIIIRLLRRIIPNQSSESDVRPANGFTNFIMLLIYGFETRCFKWWGSLPWGLSLLGVARKQ